MSIWDNGPKNSSLMHVRDQIISYHITPLSATSGRPLAKFEICRSQNCWENSPTQIYVARVFLADLMGHAVRRWTAHAQPELPSHC